MSERSWRPWRANEYEQAFVELADARGTSEIIRAGWPDFLMRRRADNKLVAIEIKRGADMVRETQQKCFAALEAGGIPVFVWNPEHPDDYTPWKEYEKVYWDRRAKKRAANRAAWRARQNARTVPRSCQDGSSPQLPQDGVETGDKST